MLKEITLCAALVGLAMVTSSLAQTVETPHDLPMPPAVESPQVQVIKIPGTDYEVILGNADFRSSASRPTEELLNAIVTWISSNFDLPAIYDHPRVELATPMKMAALRYRGLVSDRQPRAAAGLDRAMPLDLGDGIVAIYDDANKTIYLPERWTGATPGELSVLVHEMVHHLQSTTRLKFECPEAREKLAYDAQDQWLGLFGRDLADELEIDPFTVLVRTTCKY